MTVQNGEHLRAVPDVDENALRIIHLFRTGLTQASITAEPEVYVTKGHIRETGRECVVITDFDEAASDASAFATVETDPADINVVRDEVRIHFFNGLHGDPGLMRTAIDGALDKLRIEGMLPTGLATREVELTLEGEYPGLNPTLRKAAEAGSLWGEVHVADHVSAPRITQAAA